MHTMHQDNNTVVPSRSHYQAIVWLDHHEARVVHFSLDGSEEDLVCPAGWPHHLYFKGGNSCGSVGTTDPAFFNDVSTACGEAEAILLVGPPTARTKFVTYLRQHAPPIADRIAEVEPLGGPYEHLDGYRRRSAAARR